MKTYKLISGYGPGGRDCACCGPSPSFRVKHDRNVKHRERQAANKRIVRQVAEYFSASAQ